MTRLTKEIDEVMAVEMLNNEHHHKLDMIYRQLESNARVLGEFDNGVVI